jgi:hypothetical protein
MLIWEIGWLVPVSGRAKNNIDWNLKFNLSGFQVDPENILIQWNHACPDLIKSIVKKNILIN